MATHIHRVFVDVEKIEEKRVESINAVDHTLHEGQYLVTYPNGKKVVFNEEQFKDEFEKLVDHVITEDDLENNPDLKDLKVGQEVQFFGEVTKVEVPESLTAGEIKKEVEGSPIQAPSSNGVEVHE